MWRYAVFFLGAWSIAAAQSIHEFPLDAHKIVDLPVSREVTTITFPAAITAIAGSEMLIDDGRAATEVDEDAPVRFHITHAKGTNFLLVCATQPNVTATLSVIFEGAAYVLQLRAVAVDPIASAIFTRPAVPVAEKVTRPPDAVKFSPRVGFSLLDRARAYPVLARALPRAVEGVTRRVESRKIELPDLEIELDEVLRFSREDAVVFLLHLRNKTDHPLDVATSTFAARVGDERFQQAIANGPRTLAPGETREGEFAIVGLPDGTRNDLSADNAFTIVVNTSRQAPAVATNANEMKGPRS